MASLEIDPALLATFPALSPPAGVKSNFVDPESRAGTFRAVAYTSLSIMMVFLLLRIYTRARVNRMFGADDYLCIVAAASVISWCAVLLTIMGNPLGQHQWDVPISKLTTQSSQNSLVVICLFPVATMFVKCTLLVLYFRLFHTSHMAVIMIWAGIVIISLFYIASMAASIYFCYPHKGDGGWLSHKYHERCRTQSITLSVTQGTFSAVSDIYVLYIPLRLVWDFQLPTKKKVGVSAIFLTGLLACACSLLSVVYRFRGVNEHDITWHSVPVYCLSVAELNAGIICSCMPVVFVVFKGFSKRIFHIPAVRYFRPRTKQSTGEDAGLAKPSVENDEVEIPRPVMTGLRSFIRRAHRTNPTKGDTTHIESYTELESLRDGYHTHLHPQKSQQNCSASAV